MKKVTLVGSIIVGLLLPAAVAISQARQVPPNSYLRKQVSSVHELAAHINSDPVVRNRFARHFGIPPERLNAYIRENVTIIRVNESTPRNIYIVTRDGRMIAERKVLKQGTPVFALKDTGEPLLVLSCGNPVLKDLPPRERVKSETPQVYQLVRPNETPLPSPVAALPPAPLAPRAMAPIDEAPAEGLSPAASAPEVIETRRAAPWPLLGLLIGSNDNPKEPPGPPPPIPEPGGAAAVAAAGILPAAGWAFRRFASRRSSTNTE